MTKRSAQIHVECHAGYRGEETPRRFDLGAGHVEVAEVIDRWLDPDHRYFKCRVSDGGVYLLRHDEREHRWELVTYWFASAERSKK